ncbi:hypothetical protein AND_004986 [Anopheles darlingi]|uniref:Secreted protein n=1 Tax=Anopheles darlingi TaxID=43151 RepID=W5JKK6_ANODA|nr:hypothetical protein AND_004986 [Anopheles darlingi]
MLTMNKLLVLCAAYCIGSTYAQDQYHDAYPDNPVTDPPAYPAAPAGYDEVPAPAANPEPHYPDYGAEVETIPTTTTTTTTTPRTRATARRQVFPPTPTANQTPRRRADRLVRWYFLDERGIPIRTAVTRHFRSNAAQSGVRRFYPQAGTSRRSLTNGNRAAQGLQTRHRVEYWWYL